MKKQRKTIKTEQQTRNEVTFVAMNINTCISCGKEIPEGMLVCMECEIGMFSNRCTLCNRLIAESESICPNCKAIILRSKNKD